jgi:hypothetical protein
MPLLFWSAKDAHAARPSNRIHSRIPLENLGERSSLKAVRYHLFHIDMKDLA